MQSLWHDWQGSLADVVNAGMNSIPRVELRSDAGYPLVTLESQPNPLLVGPPMLGPFPTNVRAMGAGLFAGVLGLFVPVGRRCASRNRGEWQ